MQCQKSDVHRRREPMPSVWCVAKMEAASANKATEMIKTFAAMDQIVGHTNIFNWYKRSLGD